MKPSVSPEARQQIVSLRRSHSLREVAERTGIPIGTVKTICSRSGAFRDNQEHRALFSLPPIQPSKQTLPSIPALPEQKRVTGDDEIDAVIWLREVISTGQAAAIEKAFEAAKRIKTPLKTLETRYTKHLVSTSGSPFASFASIGFADLEDYAKKSVEKSLRHNEADARFGNDLFHDTDAEQFCINALAGLKPDATGSLDKTKVAAKFKAIPKLMPHTLSDCLHELTYWHELWRLRSAVDFDSSDGPEEANARRWFVFGLMAQIRQRNKAEAITVFRYMADSESMDYEESNDILLNLIGGNQ
jgi:hypothetical protein